MRIAVVNSSARRIGGAETYIERLLPELEARGHPVALLAETEGNPARPPLALPASAARWVADEMAPGAALVALAAWRPDLIYTQTVADAIFEAALFRVAPCVLFAHAYYGTCISGLKTNQWPSISACERVFGARCLGLYFPRRCGGLNPVTMVRLYRLQSDRNRLLTRYERVLTASEHIREEYVRNGVPAERVVKVGLPAVDDVDAPVALPPGGGIGGDRPIALLFQGRMDRLKGGAVLLDALPAVRAALGRPIRAVLAGEGPDRADWQKRAIAIHAANPEVTVDFPGWVRGEEQRRLLAGTDLLVVPSLWPEPFGLVGAEAGALGVPAAAFARGGIPEWLHDGVNGRLAPADPPTPAGLAGVIVECLRDPAEHARLRAGARRVAAGFAVRAHLERLLAVFAAVAEERHPPPATDLSLPLSHA